MCPLTPHDNNVPPTSSLAPPPPAQSLLPSTVPAPVDTLISISHSKLSSHTSFGETIDSESIPLSSTPKRYSNDSSNLTGNHIIDMDIFKDVINNMICPTCKENNVDVREITDSKKGLASKLIIYCIYIYVVMRMLFIPQKKWGSLLK